MILVTKILVFNPVQIKQQDEIKHSSKQARGEVMVQCGNIDSFACNISDIINYALGQYV